MAATLYIDTIYQPRYAHYLPKLVRWANRRDALRKAGKAEAAAKAQQRVDRYFDKIHERGCFSDNYCHNLLDQFGFSWHRDVSLGLLHGRDLMNPGEAGGFL